MARKLPGVHVFSVLPGGVHAGLDVEHPLVSADYQTQLYFMLPSCL